MSYLPIGASGGGSGLPGTAATVAIGAVSTGVPGSAAAITNVGTASAAIFNFAIPRGNVGEQGIQGLKGDTGNTGPASTVPGPTGSAATIAVGSVTTGAAGSSASVSNSGTTAAAVFAFTIPRGDKGLTGDTGPASTVAGPQGNPGTAAAVSVGSVTTGAVGSAATVTNAGTSSAAIFNFSIPQGAKGDTGAASTVAGPKGDPGTAATVAVGTTTTGAAGTSASVANSGTSSAAVFNFTIPQGAGSGGATADPAPLTLLDVTGSHIAARVAGTYWLAQGNPAGLTGVGTLYSPNLIYLDPLDYPAVGALTAKLRVRLIISINDVAPGTNFVIGLHPVTKPATSGAAGLVIHALGAAVAGTTVTATAPAADSLLRHVSAEFAVPAAGFYCIGFVTNAAVAASSHVHLSGRLVLRYA